MLKGLSKSVRSEVYHRGEPGAQYGIWNAAKGCWQFNICEDTPMLAKARLYQKIGFDAKKSIFEPRRLPRKGRLMRCGLLSRGPVAMGPDTLQHTLQRDFFRWPRSQSSLRTASSGSMMGMASRTG